jgi:hypothetical protein
MSKTPPQDRRTLVQLLDLFNINHCYFFLFLKYPAAKVQIKSEFDQNYRINRILYNPVNSVNSDQNWQSVSPKDLNMNNPLQTEGAARGIYPPPH